MSKPEEETNHHLEDKSILNSSNNNNYNNYNYNYHYPGYQFIYLKCNYIPYFLVDSHLRVLRLPRSVDYWIADVVLFIRLLLVLEGVSFLAVSND